MRLLLGLLAKIKCERGVDEAEFELNVGGEQVISRLQSMTKHFQFKGQWGISGTLKIKEYFKHRNLGS